MPLLRVRAREPLVRNEKTDCWYQRMGGLKRGSVFKGPHLTGRESSLSPDPIAPGVGNITILAAFDAAKPANTRFRVNILSAIQPAPVYGALHGVYAGLVDDVGLAGHPKKHVISVG